MGSGEEVGANGQAPQVAALQVAATMQPPVNAPSKPAACVPSSATSTPVKSPELKRSKVEVFTSAKEKQSVPNAPAPEQVLATEGPGGALGEQHVARTLMDDLDKAARAGDQLSPPAEGMQDAAEAETQPDSQLLEATQQGLEAMQSVAGAETVLSSQPLTATLQEPDPEGQKFRREETMTTLIMGSQSVADLATVVNMDVSLRDFLHGSGDLSTMADSDVQQLVDQWICRRVQNGDLEKFADKDLVAAIHKLQAAEAETVYMLTKRETLEKRHAEARQKVDAAVKSMQRHERQQSWNRCPDVKPEETEAFQTTLAKIEAWKAQKLQALAVEVQELDDYEKQVSRDVVDAYVAVVQTVVAEAEAAPDPEILKELADYMATPAVPCLHFVLQHVNLRMFPLQNRLHQRQAIFATIDELIQSSPAER